MTAVNFNHHGMILQLPEVDTVNREYFQHCADGVFHLQSCCSCNLLRYPPTTACPWCTEKNSKWIPVEGVGSVYSYTEVHHAIQPGLKGRTPYLVLLVELDQQKGRPLPNEAIRVIGNLTQQDGTLATPEEVARVGIGSRVRMTFTKVTPSVALPQWYLIDDSKPWRAGN